jgi:hypothetical protein
MTCTQFTRHGGLVTGALLRPVRLFPRPSVTDEKQAGLQIDIYFYVRPCFEMDYPVRISTSHAASTRFMCNARAAVS